MDVTIRLDFYDAITLSAVMKTRKSITQRDIERYQKRGEAVPAYLYDDLEEKTRLLDIIDGAIEQVRQEERARGAALGDDCEST